MYRTILVPLDGSSLAERALPYARAVARAGGAHLILLQAVEPTPLTAVGEPGNRAKALADAEAYLDGLFPGPRPASPVTVSVSVGDAGAAILEETESRGVDLIVMSTHGRSGISRAIYGSVAERVCHDAPAPVLLVPPTGERAWPAERRLRILVPLDGSPLAESAIAHAEALADALGGQLIALRVDEPPEYRRVAYPDAPEGEFFEVGNARQAGDYLAAVAGRLLAEGRAVTTRVESGPTARTILAVADEEHADLIVMATHGRSGLSGLVMGSVATGVVRQASVPVLLVRPGTVLVTNSRSRGRSSETSAVTTLGASGLHGIVASAAGGDPHAARDLLAALSGPNVGLQALVEQEIDQITTSLLWMRLIEVLALGSWGGQPVDLPRPVSLDGDYFQQRVRRALLPRVGAPAEEAKRQALRWSLDDARPEVQAAALQLIGQRGERSMTERVIAALSSNALEVEEQAATALGLLGGPAAIEALVHALESRHDVSSPAITRALVQIGTDAVPRLIDVLASPDAAARWHAAEVLADVGDPRAVEPLVRALDDPDQAVRWNAARGLARMERSGLEAVLRALATRPLTPWLAQGARYVLHHTRLSHQSRRLPALLAALGHPSASVEVPVRAAEALAEIQGHEAVV